MHIYQQTALQHRRPLVQSLKLDCCFTYKNESILKKQMVIAFSQ